MTNNPCPDCGAKPGDLHADNCDVQLCSVCDQRLSCDCEGHDPMRSAWTGEWPKGGTLDRTDLQLMLCEQIKNLDTEELIYLTKQLKGESLELVDEEEELFAGTINELEVEEPDNFSMWLSFLHSALSERLGVENQSFASRNQ